MRKCLLLPIWLNPILTGTIQNPSPLVPCSPCAKEPLAKSENTISFQHLRYLTGQLQQILEPQNLRMALNSVLFTV